MTKGVIRPFDPRALTPLRDLDVPDGTQLFVLTLPDGTVEVRETTRGVLVVWVFTRLDLLVSCCGPGQPNVRVTTAELRTLNEKLDRFVYVALDTVLPEGARYPEPDWRDLEHLPRVDTTVPDTSLLWVPIRASSVGTIKVVVEMVADEDDEPRLLVFTSLARLRAQLGERRAAASFHADVLGTLIADVHAKSVVFDPVVDERNRDTNFLKEAEAWATGSTRRR